MIYLTNALLPPRNQQIDEAVAGKAVRRCRCAIQPETDSSPEDPADTAGVPDDGEESAVGARCLGSALED
jgi:hypothetical protein